MKRKFNPDHHLAAVHLLAYLGADDDGDVSIDDDPDLGRQAKREVLASIAADTDGWAVIVDDVESNIALSTCAMRLLDAAEADCPGTLRVVHAALGAHLRRMSRRVSRRVTVEEP